MLLISLIQFVFRYVLNFLHVVLVDAPAQKIFCAIFRSNLC